MIIYVQVDQDSYLNLHQTIKLNKFICETLVNIIFYVIEIIHHRMSKILLDLLKNRYILMNQGYIKQEIIKLSIKFGTII